MTRASAAQRLNPRRARASAAQERPNLRRASELARLELSIGGRPDARRPSISRSRRIVDVIRRDSAWRVIGMVAVNRASNSAPVDNADAIYFSKPYVPGLYGRSQYARPWLANVRTRRTSPSRRWNLLERTDP